MGLLFKVFIIGCVVNWVCILIGNKVIGIVLFRVDRVLFSWFVLVLGIGWEFDYIGSVYGCLKWKL